MVMWVLLAVGRWPLVAREGVGMNPTSTGFRKNIGTPTGRLGNFFGLFPYYVK
jgi:hypothetical protein